jgi:hypothetical protein
VKSMNLRQHNPIMIRMKAQGQGKHNFIKMTRVCHFGIIMPLWHIDHIACVFLQFLVLQRTWTATMAHPEPPHHSIASYQDHWNASQNQSIPPTSHDGGMDVAIKEIRAEDRTKRGLTGKCRPAQSISESPSGQGVSHEVLCGVLLLTVRV